MYIIHVPEQPEIEPRLRATLESAKKIRDEMNTQAGNECAEIDLIHTVIKFTGRDKDE